MSDRRIFDTGEQSIDLKKEGQLTPSLTSKRKTLSLSVIIVVQNNGLRLPFALRMTLSVTRESLTRKYFDDLKRATKLINGYEIIIVDSNPSTASWAPVKKLVVAYKAAGYKNINAYRTKRNCGLPFAYAAACFYV
jgi:hypothetical protein